MEAAALMRIAAATALFVSMYLGAVWLVSRVSGWRELRAAYPAPARVVEGYTWRLRGARLRWLGAYRNALRLTANPHGIHLAPIWLFRLGHEPIWIPWADVHAEQRRSFGFYSELKLSFARVPGVPLTIGGAVADELQRSFVGRYAADRQPRSPAAD